MDRFEFYFRVLERYDNYIEQINTKALNVITVLCSLAIATTAIIGWGIISSEDKVITLTTSKTLMLIFYVCFIYLVFSAYRTCMKVIVPNTTPIKDTTQNSQKLPVTNHKSTIFYGCVTEVLSPKDFIKEVQERDDDKHYVDLLEQVHTLASIINEKTIIYKNVHNYITLSFLCTLFILVCSLVIKLG